MMSRRIAAIDFGTNTARLLIADRFENGRFEQLCLKRTIVRLGGGFSRESGLADDAIQRARDCLFEFAEAIHTFGADEVRAVATSAVRDALNGRQFVDQVAADFGIQLRVIDGLTEGTITLAGVIAGLDQQPEHILMFDVGGGSTEYTLARGGRPFFVHSLPLGVVRLTEGKSSPSAISDKISRELAILQQQLDQQATVIPPDAVLVGTAGTATTLAAIALGMQDYDYRRVNNFILTKTEIRRIYELLSPLSPTERLAIPGLEKGREDLIIAGCLLTLQTMEQFGFSSMKTSDYGLLEGLIISSLV